MGRVHVSIPERVPRASEQGHHRPSQFSFLYVLRFYPVARAAASLDLDFCRSSDARRFPRSREKSQGEGRSRVSTAHAIRRPQKFERGKLCLRLPPGATHIAQPSSTFPFQGFLV